MQEVAIVVQQGNCRATPCRKLQLFKPDDRTNKEKSSLIQFPLCVTGSHSIEILLHFNLGHVLLVFLSLRLGICLILARVNMQPQEYIQIDH